MLIPGWSATAEIWDAQIRYFASQRRVVALDPRSQGESTIVTSGNTPETRAEDLDVVLRTRGLTRPVLVGWSQDVQDVAAYVARFGDENLAGIVLVDSTISSGAKSILAAPESAAATLERLTLYESCPEDYLRGMFRIIISKPQSEVATQQLIARGLKTPPAIGAAMLIADLYGKDRSAALDGVKIPVLIIAAAHSPELQAQRTMAAHIPGARFEVVEAASHAVFIDQPERFRDIVAEFLTGVH